MHVRDLPIRDELVEHYERRGIGELYPPQAAAVEAGVAEGERVMAAIPTASGKTFIAELAMLTTDGPALYIVPLRALAREKYESFSELPDVDVGVSTGDYDATEDELAEHDVVVATSEKVDSAIRNGASWIERLACVVVDEVHLLGADGRGPTLEVTLATLGRRAPGVQIVALSATIDNPEEVADWLGATLVETEWRPVELRTGVYADGRVAFDDGNELSVPVPEPGDETAATKALVAGAVDAGGQSLSFVRSRREAERLAATLAEDGFGGAPDVAEELADEGATETGERLADCVREGVAFHHAGLRSDHRAAIENAFRERKLRVICATPTLAAGVNVPARRVVVRDLERYTGSGTEWLPVLEVHQMCGRAGRPHLDPYGEAVLVGDGDSATELRERYVEADPEPVRSKLRDRAALRTHVLSIVASGFAESREGILDVLGATFYAHQSAEMDLAGLVEEVIAELGEMEMVTDCDRLDATELGRQVSRQYVRPRTGARIVEGVRTAAEMERVTELTALEIVCDTPDMHGSYLGNRERAEIYRFARDHAAEFTLGLAEADSVEDWLVAVKLARILQEWGDGASTESIVDRFRIGPGDLESRLERAEWLLGAADAIATVVGQPTPEFARARAKLRR